MKSGSDSYKAAFRKKEIEGSCVIEEFRIYDVEYGRVGWITEDERVFVEGVYDGIVEMETSSILARMDMYQEALAKMTRALESKATIASMSEKEQMVRLEEDPAAIKFIPNPNEEMQLVAVRNNEYALDYIDNPTAKVVWESNKWEEK